MNGWMGKIVKIDLGSMKQETVAISAAKRRQYLGGRGLGVKLYTELCPAATMAKMALRSAQLVSPKEAFSTLQPL